MAQLTIYLDDNLLRGIEKSARTQRISVSKWVREKIEKALETKWPPGFLKTIGSLEEDELARPAQPELETEPGEKLL